MTALVPYRPNTTSSLMSPQLWGLLSGSLPATEAVAAITSDASLRLEAKATADSVEELARPCGENAVAQALAPLVLVFGVSDAARSPSFWRPYRMLAELPLPALNAAVDAYTRQPDATFFPKPGPLKALGDRHAEPILKALSRVRLALKAPATSGPPAQPADPLAFQALAADLAKRQSMRAASELRRPEVRSTAGKADERGLTAAMRERMGGGRNAR